MNSTQTQRRKRLSPYLAKHDAFPSMVLKERDREILLLVHEYRFLTTDLIWRLLRNDDSGSLEYSLGKDGKRRPTTYGFGEKALYKRLQALFHAGYLARHYVTDQPIGGSHGSPRAVYGLGPKSAPLVAELSGTTTQDVRRVVEANRVKSPFLKHALGVATFRAALNRACLQSGGTVGLTHWEQGTKLADYAEGVNEEGVTQRFSVYPDAFFALSVTDKGVSHFMLELDRGTMPIVSATTKPDLRKKFIGYRLYRESGRFKRRYAYHQLPDGTLARLEIARDHEKDSGLVPISGFRVLFLTPGGLSGDGTTTGRLENVVSVIASLGSAYATSSLFWFGPLDALNIDRPEILFEPIWVTPNRAKGKQSLIA